MSTAIDLAAAIGGLVVLFLQMLALLAIYDAVMRLLGRVAPPES